MQRSVCIILLPLFLCTLFGIISPSYCYSDLENSVLSVSFAVSGSDRNFTVMAPKTMMRGAKRLLEQCDAENHQNQQKIQRICSGEGFVVTRTRCNRVDQVKSRRWKTVSYPEIAEGSNSNNQNITAVANENPHMITEGQYSHPFGQASYQRSKQAMASRPRKVKGRSDEIKSRRWKQVSQPIVATDNEALEMTNEDMSILEHRDKRIRTNRQIPTVIVNQPPSLHEHSSNNNIVVPENVVNSNSLQFAESADIRGECSQSFGQALYQRTKQGSVVTYKDSGDNVYTSISVREII